MNLQCNIDEISDGRLYEINSLVKLNCDECKDCFACCQGMTNTVTLDPLDIYRLTASLNCSFSDLLKDKIELNVDEGIIIPNVKMIGEQEKCAFLNTAGRCSIHAIRPGICRIFPLGRVYSEDSFKYFLNVNGCKKKNTAKIKVKKWIDTQNYKENESFLIKWHYFIKDKKSIVKNTTDDKIIKQINMDVLTIFYVEPYNQSVDFYKQFNERLDIISKIN